MIVSLQDAGEMTTTTKQSAETVRKTAGDEE